MRDLLFGAINVALGSPRNTIDHYSDHTATHHTEVENQRLVHHGNVKCRINGFQ